MDSPLSVAADALLAKVSPPALVNHCRRTHVFGAELLRRAGRTYDAEAFHVAAMLHDLGLTEFYEDGVTPFERRGADVASAELLAQGADPAFVWLVHDAIALHLDVAAAKDPRPEVAGVTLGAAVDVLGLRLDELPAAFVAETLENYPRLGFKELIIRATREQARLKPTSLVAQYLERFAFNDLIAATPFED
jgi:HD domain